MKKILATIALAALPVASFAVTVPGDGQWFGGLVYGKSDMDFRKKTTYSLSSLLHEELNDIDEPNFGGVRFGYYFNPNVRFYGTYSYGDKDSHFSGMKAKNTTQSILFSADYLFGDKTIKPFVGLSFGGTRYEQEIKPLANTSSTHHDNSFTFGGQAGVSWLISDHINLEAGYQYLTNNNKVHVINTEENNTSIELKHTQNIYMAVDYRF